MFVLMYFSAKGDSVIHDEIAHIGAGASYLRMGDYRLNPEHPPLIKDLSALIPYLEGANFPMQVWQNSVSRANQWTIGSSYIFTSNNDTERLIMMSRIPIMLISLFLGFLVYKWAREIYGLKAGLFALLMYVFSTTILANSRYVTTDIGITAAIFANLYLLYRFITRPSHSGLLLVGLTFGLALLTKFSAVILLPVYLFIFILILIKPDKNHGASFLEGIKNKDWKKRLIPTALILTSIIAIGVVVTWAYYLPHVANMPTSVQKKLIMNQERLSGINLSGPLLVMAEEPLLKPAGLWLFGFVTVMSEIDGGRPSFLFGKTSTQGWWYYFPVAMALKTQLAIFVFLILTIIFWRKINHSDFFTETYLLIVPIVLLIIGMFTKLDLGSRYMLPIYPFIFVFISKYFTLFDLKSFSLREDKDNFVRLNTIIIISLLGWYIISCVSVYPSFVSYYNELAGGGRNGYKYLGSADTDWGQDTKRLAAWVKSNNINNIYFDHNLTDEQADYYLPDNIMSWGGETDIPDGYYAISVRKLYDNSTRSSVKATKFYDWLKNNQPVAYIGNSILIYDLRK